MGLPAKPPITVGDDNRTPTTATAQPNDTWGQPVGIGDGNDVAAGKTTDAAVTNPALPATRTGLLKGLLSWLQSWFTSANTIGKVAQGAGAGNALSPWNVAAADGDIDTMGRRNDAAATDSTSSWSVVALLKGIFVRLSAWATNTGTLLNNVSATGTGTVLDVSGMATAVLTVTGVFVGVVTWEGSTDDVNWFPVLATQMGTGAIGTTATAPGIYRSVVTGLKSLRANYAHTSGAITVKGRTTPGEAPSKSVQATLTQSNVTSQVLQNAVTAVGVGTPMDVSGMDTAVITLTGPFVATVAFEATTDDQNWFPMLATQLGAGTIANTATAPGIYRAVVTGVKSIRSNVTAYTSGAITAKGRATPGDTPSKATLATILGVNSANVAELLKLALIKDLSGNGVLPVAMAAENALDALDNKKVNITRREPVVIQTHNAVTIASGATNASTVQSASGYDQIAVGMKNDASTARTVGIDWFADAAASIWVGNETIVASAAASTGVGRITVKAPYFKINLVNGDAASHVMSSWTTLMP